jgi:hypothetical protein
MSNKVKIVGYAKKEFFNNGIEYRNFSPDLVGQQTTSNIGTSVFTSGNFNITSNLDGKVDKRFVTNEYGDFMSLDSLNMDDSIRNIFFESTKKVKLNLDSNDVLNYAYFGSLREYIRVSLENIIISWPASLYIRRYSELDPSISGSTALNYVYDLPTNQGVFEVDTERISNPFGINYVVDGTISDTFNETNDLRNLPVNYSDYIISNDHGDFPIIDFTGATGTTSSILSITVQGNPFPLYSTENIFYHIKPNEIKTEEFFISLNEFERNLLNRNSTPMYTGSFDIVKETDTGASIEVTEKVTWPTSDGYNIDFNSQHYIAYVNNLLSLAASSDDLRSNLMVRFLVSKSISEFDTIPDIDGTYEAGNAQKMTSALKIYGREFDELKRYMDGIAFAHTVTYDKKNNTPDIILKNLARIMGWDLISSIEEVDLITNYLKPKSSTYDGIEVGLTNTEAEIELWRRIILNTPWIWKSKGTRKTIEFLFKFIGTPDGLVTFNEYIYIADKALDVDNVEDIMEHFNNTRDISSLNIDEDGFPKTQPNNLDMYFQKAGLWYRTTGGPNPDIDILYGNNPHIGPYDGGQAYIDQFSNCLVPNFVGVEGFEDVNSIGNAELFTNFNNGTFDGNDLVAEFNTCIDLSGVSETNIDKFIDVNPVSESGCTGTTVWTLNVYLSGETIHSEPFLSGTTTLSATSIPTQQQYIDALFELTGTTELSGLTFISSGCIFKIIDNTDACDSDLNGAYLKIEVCVDTTFDCIDEGAGLDAIIAGGDIDCDT